MGKCGEAGRLASPREKFGCRGTAHGDKMFEYLKGMPRNELLEHIELSDAQVDSLGAESGEALALMLVSLDNKHKPLSDGDFQTPDKKFQNESTILREARSRGLGCVRGKWGGFGLALSVKQLFSSDVSSTSLLGAVAPCTAGRDVQQAKPWRGAEADADGLYYAT